MAAILLYTDYIKVRDCKRRTKIHRLCAVYLIILLLTIGAMADTFSKRKEQRLRRKYKHPAAQSIASIYLRLIRKSLDAEFVLEIWLWAKLAYFHSYVRAKYEEPGMYFK